MRSYHFMYLVTVETLRPGQARHTHLRSYRGNLNNVCIFEIKIARNMKLVFCFQLYIYIYIYISFGSTAPQWGRVSLFIRFLDHTQRRTTVGRTPLDDWSARHRDLCLTTHNTHNRQTSTWQHTTLTRDSHPCFRRDSNSQSQQARGRRPTP